MRDARSPSSPKAQAYLCLQGHEEPIVIGAKFHFGRTPSLNHNSISTHHFTISANDGGVFYILDNDSRTGTTLNGSKLKPNEWYELKEAAKIAVGPYLFIFTHKKAKSAGPTPPVKNPLKPTLKPAPVVTPRAPVIAKTVSVPVGTQELKQRRDIMLDEREDKDSHKNDNTFLIGMASLNIIIFAFLLMTGGDLHQMDKGLMLKFGANSPHLTTNGEWWRMFAAAFLHWDIWHLFGNVSAMYFATSFIIRYLTPNKIIAVYLGSAFFCSALSALFQPAHVIAAGASGAVFGLYGAIIVSAVLYHQRGIKMDKGLVLTAVYFSWQNLGIGQTGVDVWGHLGGLLGGAIICYFCIEMLPENDSKSAGKLFGTLAVAMMAIVMAMPKRHIPTQQQMGLYFDRYISAIEIYYQNIKSYDRDHSFARYEKIQNAVLQKVALIEGELQKEKARDSRGQYLQAEMLQLFKLTRNHAAYMKHIIKTDNQKYWVLAKKVDNEMAKKMQEVGGNLGALSVAKQQPPQQARERTPAARHR